MSWASRKTTVQSARLLSSKRIVPLGIRCVTLVGALPVGSSLSYSIVRNESSLSIMLRRSNFMTGIALSPLANCSVSFVGRSMQATDARRGRSELFPRSRPSGEVEGDGDVLADGRRANSLVTSAGVALRRWRLRLYKRASSVLISSL